ncbi:MAG: hypothetical protein Q7J73_02280, partial [Dehalococcoidales bacterium]|nr:hypothetical protein [Dehalococcoidales bacterium]
ICNSCRHALHSFGLFWLFDDTSFRYRLHVEVAGGQVHNLDSGYQLTGLRTNLAIATFRPSDTTGVVHMVRLVAVFNIAPNTHICPVY